MRIEQNVLLLGNTYLDSYLAAWIAELLRFHLLASRQSLTFETVISYPSKLDFLREARLAGYRTYLYFVATADPATNIARVAVRVAKGGHPVAQNKIVERYHRSLAQLRAALKLIDRAHIIDNSGTEPVLVA